eukprot:1232814-Prymnesium_polylepis.1
MAVNTRTTRQGALQTPRVPVERTYRSESRIDRHDRYACQAWPFPLSVRHLGLDRCPEQLPPTK